MPQAREGRPPDGRNICLPNDGHAFQHAAVQEQKGGPVAWQPPHRQDEDLVPLTAGACSPHRRSSRRIPGQTSGPDPNPDASSGAASWRPRTTPEPGRRHCRTADPLARWVKQRSAGCASVPSRHARRRSTPKSGPGSRRVYLAFEPPATLPPPYRSTPNQGQPSRDVVGATSVRRRAASAARSGSGHAPQALMGVARIAESGWAECLWPQWQVSQHRPGSRPG